MGQRLNIEITDGDKCLANAYYHWRGFTSSALEASANIVSSFDEVSDIFDDPYLIAFNLLESTGAGINDVDRLEIAADPNLPETVKTYDFNSATSRNAGLISVTESQIEQTRRAEEGRVTIDITNKTVHFNCWMFDRKDEYEEFIYDPNTNDLKYEDLPDLKDFDPFEIPFDRYSDFSNYILGLINAGVYCVKSEMPDVGCYSFIE